MFRPRIIPVLLLQKGYLVKSVGFKDHRYIGDPINAVRIFNELKADELIFLDIDATRNNTVVSSRLVQEIGEEADMPFGVGGGITSLAEIRELIGAGAEKVVLGSIAVRDPLFIKAASEEFGSSTISVCIDVKKNFWGNQKVVWQNARQHGAFSPAEFAQLAAQNGAGEIILQSVDNDGSMKGYDYALLQQVAQSVRIPVVALGGAGSFADLQKAYHECQVNAMAAGSIFVYLNKQKGVLINYPDLREKKI